MSGNLQYVVPKTKTIDGLDREEVAQERNEKTQLVEKNKSKPFKVYSKMPKGQEGKRRIFYSADEEIVAAGIMENEDTCQEYFSPYLKRGECVGKSYFYYRQN